MFGIFWLLFLLFKIFIYSIVYAIVTLIIIYLVSKTTSIIWIRKIMALKVLSFIALVIVYGIIFFVYSFSYWQDNGFGDSFKIPFGNGYQVSNIDGTSTYFEESGRQAFLTDLSIENGKLCANFQGFNSTDCQDCYIVFDSEKSKMYEFSSRRDYELFATKNHLPFPHDFKDFMTIYYEYWESHDRWYLP